MTAARIQDLLPAFDRIASDFVAVDQKADEALTDIAPLKTPDDFAAIFEAAAGGPVEPQPDLPSYLDLYEQAKA